MIFFCRLRNSWYNIIGVFIVISVVDVCYGLRLLRRNLTIGGRRRKEEEHSFFFVINGRARRTHTERRPRPQMKIETVRADAVHRRI